MKTTLVVLIILFSGCTADSRYGIKSYWRNKYDMDKEEILVYKQRLIDDYNKMKNRKNHRLCDTSYEDVARIWYEAHNITDYHCE